MCRLLVYVRYFLSYEVGKRTKWKKKKEKEQQILNFHVIFLTVGRITGTLWVYFTLDIAKGFVVFI